MVQPVITISSQTFRWDGDMTTHSPERLVHEKCILNKF